jgi:hypothetical protein
MLLGPRGIAVSHRVVLCIAQFPGASVGPVRVLREQNLVPFALMIPFSVKMVAIPR